MSEYETRDMTGKLFKNSRKEKEAHPDYNGECLIDGVAYFMDAWLKPTKAGGKWMSFAFKAKDRQPQQATQPRTLAQSRPLPPKSALPPGRDDYQDDIPF